MKIFSYFLLLVFSVSLFGCGGSGSAPKVSDQDGLVGDSSSPSGGSGRADTPTGDDDEDTADTDVEASAPPDDNAAATNDQTATTGGSESSSVASEMIYDGESVLFAAAAPWGGDGSQLVESSAAPFSGDRHLRATLSASNWWAAAAYLPSGWQTMDWSNGLNLSFQAKADTPMTLSVYLFDGNEKQSVTGAALSLSTDYKAFSIALAEIDDGITLNRVTAIVFAFSDAASGSFIVDIDDIALSRGNSDEGNTNSNTDQNSATTTTGIAQWKKSETQWLHTQGNKIYYADGSVFRARGANIHDTRSCNACTWNAPNVAEVLRRIDVLVDGWGANFLRLNLESYAAASGRTHWQSFTSNPQYLAEIVEIVEHIGSKPGVYVLVSLWAEPTTTDMGWPTEATNDAWSTLAERLAGQAHVLFGIVNEPQSNSNGAYDADVWQRMNSAVAAIRSVETSAQSPRHIISVQGTRRWARDLEYYVNHPITAGDGENIAYETHAYVSQSEFDKTWLGPSATLPVIIGEFGPSDYSSTEDIIALMDLAEQRDLPWLAWTFHMRCNPSLLVDTSGGGCGINMNIVPSEWGTLIKNRLAQPWVTPVDEQPSAASNGTLGPGSDGIFQIWSVGDSITEGVANSYRNGIWAVLTEKGYTVDFVGTKVHEWPDTAVCPDADHDGHPGFTTSQIAESISSWHAQISEPDVVLLMAGTNDLAWWVLNENAWQTTTNSMMNLVDTVLALRSDIKVIVSTIAPMSSKVIDVAGVDRALLGQRYNAALKNAIQNHRAFGTRLWLADVDTSLSLDDLYDGIHPEKAANEKMANAWLAVMTPLLSTP